MEISELEAILEKTWTLDTSADPENWTPANPAWGQCAVTALIIDDYLGGEIIWAEIKLPEKAISHYFNKIEGKEVDLTRRQFPADTIIPKGVPKTKGFPTTRDYILSYELTQIRYDILKKRVQAVLQE
jgi:hypothetical protein